MNIKAQLSRLWSNQLAPEIAPELAELNAAIEPLSAAQRVERPLELLPGEHVMTSNFGAQSAVMLHLVNTVMPGVPVVLLDTGYLFPETYGFIDELTDRLKLNLKVFRAESSAAWQETRFGKLWDQGEPTCQAAKTSSATSQTRPLIRTSSAIEVIARVLVLRPLAVRWLNPPRSRFSWTYVEDLFMCSGDNSSHRSLDHGPTYSTLFRSLRATLWSR